MTDDNDSEAGADRLRQRNRDLDTQLLDLVAQVPEAQLHTDPGDGEWSLAENLAHIGEFPCFFAREIAAMLRADVDEDLEVGRTHEHPDRVEAVAAAAGRNRDQLADAVATALDEMANTLRHVTDDDLQRTFTNRKYGAEPLIAYLERYVLGHKAAHVDQLRRTLRLVGG